MSNLVIPGGRRALPTPLTQAEKDAIATAAAGGLADVQSGGRLFDHPKTISDWDAADENGFYQGLNAANAPNPGIWYKGLVIAHSDTYTVQEVCSFTLSPYTPRFDVYRRRRVNGIWGEWLRLATAPLQICRAYAAGGATVVAQNDQIGFGTLAVNVGNFSLSPTAADHGGSGIVVPSTGFYEISGLVYVQSAGTMRCQVCKNGTTQMLVDVPAGTASRTGSIPSTLYSLAANDVITIKAGHAGQFFLGGTHTELSIKRVG